MLHASLEGYFDALIYSLILMILINWNNLQRRPDLDLIKSYILLTFLVDLKILYALNLLREYIKKSFKFIAAHNCKRFINF